MGFPSFGMGVWAPFAKRLCLVKVMERPVGRDLKGSGCSVLRGPAVKLALSPTFLLSQPEDEIESR